MLYFFIYLVLWNEMKARMIQLIDWTSGPEIIANTFKVTIFKTLFTLKMIIIINHATLYLMKVNLNCSKTKSNGLSINCIIIGWKARMTENLIKVGSIRRGISISPIYQKFPSSTKNFPHSPKIYPIYQKFTPCTKKLYEY